MLKKDGLHGGLELLRCVLENLVSCLTNDEFVAVVNYIPLE